MNANVLPTDTTQDRPSRMIRRALAALGASSLIIAASFLPAAIASAATQTVTVTINGYVPMSSTIAAGDSIGFVNADITVHQIVFKQKAGLTCTPNPLVLQPTATGVCTFQNSGTYAYSDPNIKTHNFTGTVVVTKVTPSVALAVTPGVAVYGHGESLSGKTSNQSAGQNVQLFAQTCGQTKASVVGTTTTAAGGAFSFGQQPVQNTSYSVKVGNLASNAVLSQVYPLQQLTKTSLHHFLLRVSATVSFAGKFVTLQRHDSVRGWVNVKRVTLRSNSTGVAPTVISSVSFKTTIARPQRIRTVLGQGQVGTCYAAGTSNVIYN
jgi:plastocyanin